MEKYGLLLLVVGKDSEMLDEPNRSFLRFRQRYALENATLVLIFAGERAYRAIAGGRIFEIDTFPPFDDSSGRPDVASSIQNWLYEAQANMYSGGAHKLSTAVFVDLPDDVMASAGINHVKLLESADETDYYRMAEHDGIREYERVALSAIDKLESLASAGDEAAQYKLALAYLAGEGVRKNPAKAQMLLFKSFMRGNIDALYAAIDLFDEPDKYMCKEAAKRGHAKALRIMQREDSNMGAGD